MISVFFILLAVFSSLTSGDICKSPTIKPISYTTTDGLVISDIALITEFSVVCDKDLKDLSLYADMKGNTFSAVKSLDGTKYQVSWTEESSKLASGTQDVKIYDEEGFAALRKAQRNGEKTSSIPSTFSVPIYHMGTYYGPWVQSEFLAATCSVILWYIAFSARSKLIS